MPDLKLNDLNQPVTFPQLEEKVLEYWDEVKAFERSVNERPESKPFVFYDGPPFATGLPHYGHLLGSVMKDIVPRYWTMKGYRVERRWGWDCHGLPIENIIEQELNLKGGKKGIEEYGIANFNNACRAAIMRFDKQWQQVIRRIGRWVDMDNSYKTMDTTFMESVWWAFKQLYEKGLVYQGRKVILYCPRCSTPLSNFEIAMDNSYKDVADIATTYKFPVKGQKDTYLLAWSTTPWNKLVTPALGVNPDLAYVTVKQGNEKYILAETTLKMLEGDYEIVGKQSGNELENLEFELLFDFYPNRDGKRAGVVVADDFVTASEGTGIVTLAVYGEDDYRVMQKHNIQSVEHVDDEGRLKPEITHWAGLPILKANPLIDEALKERGLIYAQHPYTHSVPTCYRCGTRLYYAPVPAWFIDIQKIKPDLVKNNESINWFPGHLKHGRFGKGIETAPDWNISRSRYWGTPMPIWYRKDVLVKSSGSESKEWMRVIGSIDELKQWAVDPKKVEKLTDIHREYVDDIEVWLDDEKTISGKRVKEVFDCWVESGSMSFAEHHYPFENKNKFEARFPAQYIVEYIAQTRAWFYTLHVMATALFGKPAFQNALTTGTIMAEDGTKMSKSKKNYPDPMEIINQFGVDSLRLYFSSSPLMKTAENVNFNRAAIDEIRKKVLNTVWNVFKFYQLFDDGVGEYGFPGDPQDVMDKWVISITNNLVQAVTKSMDSYDVVTSSRLLMDYVQDLSTWYVRRSRDRFRQGNKESLQVLRTALRTWVLLSAPFAPFITEVLYQNMPGAKLDSVHLEALPTYNEKHSYPQLEPLMAEARRVVERAHALRKEAGIKVRQPLASLIVTSTLAPSQEKFLEVIADEVNVKKVIWEQGSELKVTLDTKLTPQLQAEGEARELVRKIQDLRKEQKTARDAKVIVELPSWPKDFEDYIKTKVLAQEIKEGPALKVTAV